MKKLVVLTLVMMMASLASAALVSGNVTWSVVGSQLIGTGTARGDVDLYIAGVGFGDCTTTIVPDPTTDGANSKVVIIIRGWYPCFFLSRQRPRPEKRGCWDFSRRLRPKD